MLHRSDPRIASAMTSDASALTLLNQLHLEIAHTQDASVLSASLGQYAAISAARIARRSVPPPLPSAVTSPGEQYLQGQTSLRLEAALQRVSKAQMMIMNMLRKAADESNGIVNNMK